MLLTSSWFLEILENGVKAYAYLRVSGKGQVEGDGFPRQRQAIKKYAATNGIKLVQFFEEQGVSGTVENMDRPAWRDLIAALHADGIARQ